MRVEVTNTRTLKDDEPDVRVMEYRNGPVSIGSSSDCMLQIADTSVANHQADFLKNGEEWSLAIKASDPPMKLNDDALDGQRTLSSGDVIELSYFEIRVTMEDESSGPSAAERVAGLAEITKYPLPAGGNTLTDAEDVLLSDMQRQRIAAFAVKFAECRTLVQVLETAVASLLENIGAHVAWMGVRREGEKELEYFDSKDVSGAPVVDPPLLETLQYRCLKRKQFINISRSQIEGTRSIMGVPLMGKRGTIGMIYASTRDRSRVFDLPDLHFVMMLAELIQPRLIKALEEIDTGGPQVDDAAHVLLEAVRERIIPEIPPEWDSLDAAAFSKKGSGAHRDVYDLVTLPNGLAAVMVATAEGDPAGAALGMCEARAAFRTMCAHQDPPHATLKMLNWLLYDEESPIYASTGIALINPKTGAIQTGTAGRIGAIIVDESGKPRALTNAEALAVGAKSYQDYKSNKEKLAPGELLALYTAGCASATRKDGKECGGARVAKAILESAGQSAAAALDDVVTDLEPWFKSGKNIDDITLVMVHRPKTL